MSTSVHDILGAIGDAQRALQAEPQYRSEIEGLQKRLDEAMRHSQALELNINGYKDNIDNLQGKVRSLEVERDDTGFRLLETEDKLDKLVKASRTMASALAGKVDEVDPPKPVPSAVQVAPQATEALALHAPSPYPEPIQEPHPVQATADQQGSQSAADPTVSSTDSPSADYAPPPDKPYAGKRYREVPGYVSYDDWITGGGTANSYYVNN